jgi:antitoxin YefM
MAITASDARAKLFPLIEKVNADQSAVVITSKNGNAVLISESEYEAMIETNYLLASPANREHLLESIKEGEAGLGTVYPRGHLLAGAGNSRAPVKKAKKKTAAKAKKSARRLVGKRANA